ncbi:esterase [Catellatospora methionotrophica]|uniref:Esterase n=1 Tax=Catellatospora methionotrophica TaxID=121620 RepID=A0A8J3PG07_9ACTN|nr:serine hydrolase domain-containing protein [Catellatospora methionotrophica]GIG15767.1 esterase [Catellatospora methionotrophica]
MYDEIRRLMAAAPMPAVAVSVFDRTATRFSEVTGTADRTTGRPVGSDDWWDLASVTKTLVTLPEVLAHLDLDRPLADVWARADGHPVGRATVAQLLSHQAGLPAVRQFFRTAATRDEIVAQAVATPLAREPGGEAEYSDLGFLLLGEAVQDHTGVSLDELARRRSGLRFGPVPGSAVATEQCAWRGRLVVGEVHDENAYAMGGVAGQAGGFGTLAQVTAAAQSWLAGTVLPAHLHRAATRCWAENSADERFGLGWWLPPTRGIGGHHAGVDSYGCSGFVGNRIWLEPARDYGVVILSNRVHPSRDHPEPFRDWCATLLDTIATHHP